MSILFVLLPASADTEEAYGELLERVCGYSLGSFSVP